MLARFLWATAVAAVAAVAWPELRAAAQAPGPSITFTDVTAAAGIRFRHTNGAFGRKYLPETMGSGAAFLDVDADGWQDLFLVNSTHFPGRQEAPGYPALFKN